MKTKVWILLLSAVFVLCVGLGLWFLLPRTDAGAVEVYSDGKLLYTLSLQADQSVEVTLDQGRNVVTIQDGKAAVTQANCPDGYCMQRGFCSGGAQIVCLPNRLVLKFVGSADVDFVVG